MDLLNVEDVASVMLFDIRISEGELQILADALAYLLESLNKEQLHNVFVDMEEIGDRFRDLPPENQPTPDKTEEFVQGVYEELMMLIVDNCRQEFLPNRFKLWNPSNDLNTGS
jgi:hypothetical protein